MQVWCILTDTEEADVTDKTSTGSSPLTVCTYPEVRTTPLSLRFPLVPCLLIGLALNRSVSFRHLQIFVLSGVIAMVTCAVFLRLNSLLKLAVLLLAVAVYSYLIHVAFLVLVRHDVQNRSVRIRREVVIAL